LVVNFEKIIGFLTNMDKKAWRSAMVLIVMFALVLGLILFARPYLAMGEDGLSKLLSSVKSSPFAPLMVALIFTGAAFLGLPQWILIAATVIAFGPIYGGVYAWVATLVSASVDFWIARLIGAQKLETLPSEFVERMILMVRKNGMLASFAVRLVPTGPFVLVNMAAGVSGLKFWAFLLGTGAGIIPKILVVALLAQGILTRQQGETVMLLSILGLALILLTMYIARRLLRPVVKHAEGADESL
jgi:uncharacterized membrane protein YdjX (TVP38/TMEM64 family)